MKQTEEMEIDFPLRQGIQLHITLNILLYTDKVTFCFAESEQKFQIVIHMIKKTAKTMISKFK